MSPNPLTNSELQKYYQNEPKFNDIYSINHLSNMIMNQQELIGLIALYVNVKNVINFDSFGVEHIPPTIKKVIRNKNIITNIYRIQAYDSLMSCIGFIDFMLKGKRSLAYTNLFSPSDYKKNVKIILKYFQQYLIKLKCIVIFETNREN